MSLFSRFSLLSRERKMERFYEAFKPDEKTRILDVGAEIAFSAVRGLQLIDFYQWPHNLTALNIDETHIGRVKEKYPDINAVVGDACHLPFEDNAFDIIYSNAVIEHVGDYRRQRQMAQEIMRVGKNWFVTTPNRWYPFEFHLRLPMVTWLPFHGYLTAGQIVSYNHVQRKYKFFQRRHEHLRLMSESEMKACFPQSRIIMQRITFMPETIIAVGGDDIEYD